jgi:predicted NUDIX family NTP pyrophosphohydrolase
MLPDFGLRCPFARRLGHDAGHAARAPARPMKKASAGLLLYRRAAGGLEVLLVHPGGPYWARKDLGAWSIPKGEIESGEEPLAAARREFAEETGGTVDGGEFLPLRPVKLRSGKVVHAWAVQAEFDPAALRSNLFTIEWPPRSGEQREFPEADRAAWFGIDEARVRIHAGQAPLLDDLLARLRGGEA